MDTNRHEMGPPEAQPGTSNGTGAARRGRRSEAQRTADLLESLPEGIQIGHWRDGRRKAFFVRYGKERKVESFEMEGDRNDLAEKKAQAAREHGTAILEVDPKEWMEWKAFRQRVPAPLHELEAAWLAQQGAPKISVLTKDAVLRYLTLRLAEDMEENSDTHRHVKLHLQRLVDFGGELPLNSWTPDLIRDVLAKLVGSKGKSKGKPVSKLTKRHHRKDWNTFFKRCGDEGWMTAKNPCSAVKPPRVEDEDKTPLKAREVFDLLHFNHAEPVVGRIALELYGFLRAASAERAKKEHLRFDVKGIRLPGFREDEETGQKLKNHKSGKTKFRQGHPEILWLWLAHASEECWTAIDEGNYGHKKSQAFLRARVTNPGNALRDTCISTHLAAFKNPPQTAYFAQHSRMAQTETYEGVMEEADAKLIMAMTPDAVRGSWEEFVAAQNPR